MAITAVTIFFSPSLVPVHLRRAMTIDEGDHITARLSVERMAAGQNW